MPEKALNHLMGRLGAGAASGDLEPLQPPPHSAGALHVSESRRHSCRCPPDWGPRSHTQTPPAPPGGNRAVWSCALSRGLFVSAPNAPNQTLGDTGAAPPAGCKAGGTAGPPSPHQAGRDSRNPQPPPGKGQLPAAAGLRESRAQRLLLSQGCTDLVSLLIALCRAAKASVPTRGPGHLPAEPSGLVGLQRAWPSRE